jgi:hypothetical protein
MKPRKLRVLRLDDKLSAKMNADKSRPEMDVPSDQIGVYALNGFTAISSWKISIQFWAAYNESAAPDLVVADVLFDRDLSSPLAQSMSGIANYLPTGLSHLKPFAALARATGHLLGVGIHTWNATLWERLQNEESPLHQCMSYLAAHEIGELAAILEETKLVESVVAEQSLTPLWRWLEKNARASFNGALRLALRNYRKRLHALAAPPPNQMPSLFVMPDDYASLMSWCESMRKNPRPLDACNDRGLTLTYRDGKRDCIFLSSIFADVEDITTRTLDASCFDPQGGGLFVVDDPVNLDPLGLPCIGAFLERLGTVQKVYAQAARALEAFPYLPEQIDQVPVTLNDELPNAMLARGFAAMFQSVRIEFASFERWAERLKNHAWDARGGKFLSDVYRPEDSLKTALEKLITLIRATTQFDRDSKCREPFSIDEVLEVVKEMNLSWVVELTERDADSGWLRWHFERLVDARILEHALSGEYELVSDEKAIGVLRMPRTFANSESVEKVLDLPTMKNWFKRSLGFYDNDNARGILLYDAFVQRGAKTPNDKAREGRKFAELYEHGNGPFWLLKLCRKYAENVLNWRDRRTWPKWLHRAA